jgi:hypothetical protein
LPILSIIAVIDTHQELTMYFQGVIITDMTVLKAPRLVDSDPVGEYDNSADNSEGRISAGSKCQYQSSNYQLLKICNSKERMSEEEEDGKIYRGIVTFSASQPVEIVVLHPFNQTNNATGTIPLTREDENTAITLMHAGEGALFDTMSFAGSSLVFHSRSPVNFTISYTIVGDLVDPTSLPPDAR